jgi:hypothetical protein
MTRVAALRLGGSFGQQLKDGAMNTHPVRHNRPVNDELHPLVYKTIIGLTIWLVLSIWALFDRGTYIGLVLGIITLFFVIVTAIPLVLWQAWRGVAAANGTHRHMDAFRDWASHEFVTWTERLSGKEAAIQILLPLAAVAFGMTIFGLVFNFTVPNLGS